MLLLDIKQTNATFGGDLAKTSDHKVDEVKNELCPDIRDMKLNISKNASSIVNIECQQTEQKVFVTNLEQKIVDLEDLLTVYSKRVEKNVLEANEHIQTVKCALAEDIETIKVRSIPGNEAADRAAAKSLGFDPSVVLPPSSRLHQTRIRRTAVYLWQTLAENIPRPTTHFRWNAGPTNSPRAWLMLY